MGEYFPVCSRHTSTTFTNLFCWGWEAMHRDTGTWCSSRSLPPCTLIHSVPFPHPPERRLKIKVLNILSHTKIQYWSKVESKSNRIWAFINCIYIHSKWIINTKYMVVVLKYKLYLGEGKKTWKRVRLAEPYSLFHLSQNIAYISRHLSRILFK